MAIWDELRGVLSELARRDPSPLSGHPDHRSATDPRAPYGISLTSWAAADAAELHQRFGSQVELTVGIFRYPQLTRERGGSGWPRRERLPADAAGLTVTLESPLVLRSGHSAQVPARVSNASEVDVSLRTNRQLQSRIVDSGGHEVGACAGAQRMPGVGYDVPSGSSVSIPVLVGTDSLDPTAGYAVPPGRWFLEIHLQLGDRRQLRSEPLPIDIVA